MVTQKPDNEEQEIVPEARKVSDHVWLEPVFNGAEWRSHVVIDEETTINEIREVWSEICVFRDKVFKLQSNDPQRVIIPYLMEVYIKHKKRVPYSVIARDINFELFAFALLAFDDQQNKEFQQAGRLTFLNILLGLGMSQSDVKDWEEYTCQEIKENRLPWNINDEPIDRDRVITSKNTVRNWINNGKIIVPDNFESTYLRQLRLIPFTRGYLQRAADQLNRLDPEAFKSHEQRYNDLVCRIIKPR